MGPSRPFPSAALPMASDPPPYSYPAFWAHPVPIESLSQTSWDKGCGRRGRNIHRAGKGGWETRNKDRRRHTHHREADRLRDRQRNRDRKRDKGRNRDRVGNRLTH